MDINQWAADTANEHIATIKWYIDEGMTKEWAIDKVLNGSTLGSKYKEMVIEIVEQEHWNKLVSI